MKDVLETRLRHTIHDFEILDHMLQKNIEVDQKGAVARIQNRWRKIFADRDVERMRTMLVRSRDALKASALVLQWSLGNAPGEHSIGFGYTGLAATLDNMKKRPTLGRRTRTAELEELVINANREPEPTVLRSLDDPPSTAASDGQIRERHVDSASPDSQRPVSLSQILLPGIENARTSLSVNARSVSDSIPSVPSFKAATIPRSTNEGVHPTPGTQHAEGTHTPREDGFPSTLNEAGPWIEEMENFDIETMDPDTVLRIKADPSSMPHWAAENVGGGNTDALRTTLISAIEGRNHRLIEQVLDKGVSPDSAEMHLLREAVLNHDTESLLLLLLFGADPNRPDTDGVTPLYSAVHVAYPEGAKALLNYGADPNLVAGPLKETPLDLAISQRNPSLLRLLLIYGGNPNHIADNGNAPLIQAIDETSPKRIVDLLLAYDADTNIKDEKGKTALCEAVLANRPDIVMSLLDHGADPNFPGPKHVLWLAVYKPGCLRNLLLRGADFLYAPGIMELATSINSAESVRILLQAGVNPNVKKDSLYTPLCTAIRDNRVDIVRLLLSHGANPNLVAMRYPIEECVARSRNHMLPILLDAGADIRKPLAILETAARARNVTAMSWLLNHGADPNAKSQEGYTPLTTAIRTDLPDGVSLLLSHKADVSLRGNSEWPICHSVRHPHILKLLLPHIKDIHAYTGVMEQAIVANQLESVAMLLDAGISIEEKNSGIFSPLTTAIREHREDIVKYLLERGANPNALGEHLPLVKALRRTDGADTAIVRMLIRKGADVNTVYRGWNAVMQAVENGDLEILKLVASQGVDLNIVGEGGRTALSIAKAMGWEEGVKILEENALRSTHNVDVISGNRAHSKFKKAGPNQESEKEFDIGICLDDKFGRYEGGIT
ncbi:hypothetical protein jhhlp_008332 [Lomentospora prolificans]|uniref:Uncharacterized protein n=1 Tax=Lomentospora prolificans TaxID=41688 RepID=A0A2N3MXR6_9PEZI|nr:hypothetical protein jhhlp_008332 [Lomentospora prolificans]